MNFSKKLKKNEYFSENLCFSLNFIEGRRKNKGKKSSYREIKRFRKNPKVQ